MDRKKELKQQFKEIKVEAGVYQIRNTKNGKILVEGTRNLKTINGRTFMLNMNTHNNAKLQAEWNKYGEEAFVIEVLEILKRPESGYFDEKHALKKLEEKWLNELTPYGERGYN